MKLHFSAIIPAYNAEKYIGATIESCLAQESVGCEVIVVDDGSDDNTLAVVRSFGNRVRIVCQKNAGPAAARNHGASLAKGDVLAFLDADDLWLPEKLSHQSAKLLEGYDLVYSNRLNMGEIGDLPLVQSEVQEMPEGDIWQDLLLGNFITTSSVVIRKELFARMGGFSLDLPPCEDWDLWLRCAERVRVGFCPTPLVQYRLHAAGISRNFRLMSRQRMKVIARALRSDPVRTLPLGSRKQILARTWATSAWDAARGKDLPQALAYFARALGHDPFDGNIWYNVARALAGRI